MRTLNCPFCPFADSCSYFLAQHVETYHPETDQSPSVARHFLESERLPPDRYHEDVPISDSSSEGYVECECGETVASEEYNDHLFLHLAESTDTVLESSEPLGDHNTDVELATPSLSNTPRNERHGSLLRAGDAYFPSNEDLPRSPKRRHSPQNSPQKSSHHGFRDWIDALVVSRLPRSSYKSAPVTQSGTKRLGVSLSCLDVLQESC